MSKCTETESARQLGYLLPEEINHQKGTYRDPNQKSSVHNLV